MINLKDNQTGEINHHYECTVEASIELCFANLECLLRIALADTDEHIEKLGGEAHLLELMNGYLNLAERLAAYQMDIEWKCRKILEKEGNEDG
jgi:hypothetical protein